MFGVKKLSQPPAGEKHGILNGVEGIRVPLGQTEVTKFKKAGIVPVAMGRNGYQVYGIWTPIKGDNINFEHFAVMRVINFIDGVLSQFLQENTFNLINKKIMDRKTFY